MVCMSLTSFVGRVDVVGLMQQGCVTEDTISSRCRNSKRMPRSLQVFGHHHNLSGWHAHGTDMLTRRDLTSHGMAQTDTDGA